MLRGLCFSVLMFALTSIAMGDIFITEIADPNGLDQARFVELFNNGSEDVNLGDGWSLGRYTNANTSMTTTTRIPLRGVIPAGGFYIVCNNADTFFETYGMAADQSDVNGGPADSNGDDNILLLNPAWEVVDFFGRPGEDGNLAGSDHEFEDGRAERVSTVTAANPTYDPAEWDLDNDSGGGDGAVSAPDGYDPRVWFTHSEIDFSLKSVMTLDMATITVSFSHALDTATAEMVANYDAGTLGAPATATLAGINSVELGFAADMVHGTEYTLTVNNVKNIDSTLTLAASSTIAYSYYDYTGMVVISEFVYNGEGPDNEWFELYNASAETIDISGWMFRDEPLSHDPIVAGVTSNNILAPGDYFTVYAYGEGEENGWPLQFTPDLNAAINYSDTSRFHLWNLNNSSDIIYMWDSMGNLVDSIAYDQDLPGTVPVEAYRGIGHTIEVVDLALSNDDPTNWQASYFYGGTPGSENVTEAPIYPGVVISEVMYHSSLFDSAQVEWIEIFNTEIDSVDISGWYTLDDNPTHTKIPFPAGTKIGPGEYLTVLNAVASDTFPVPFTADFNITTGDIDYSDSKDNPLLFDAEGNLVTYMYYDDGGAGEMFEHAAGADGLGYSLELIDPTLSNHDPLNWQASGGLGGTPGEEPLDEFPPTLVSAYALSDSIITVVFSESIDSTVAVAMANYSVNNAIGTPTAVVWNDYKVELSVAHLTHETVYEVTVSNVADVSGNVIVAGSMTSFVYQTYVNMIVINEFQYNSEYY